jgi:hypothetical protein
MPAIIISQSPTEVKIELTVNLTGNMLDSEFAIQEAVNEAGKLATGCALESFDTDGSAIEIAGRRLHPKKLNGSYKQPKIYQTPYGKTCIERYVYQGSGGGASYSPLDTGARIISTSTPMMAKLVSAKYSRMGGRETVDDFLDHGREVEKKYVQNMAENVAQIAGMKEENWRYTTPELDTFVRSVTIGIDGGRANFLGEGWRDVMVGTIAIYDLAGERQHTIYIANAPEYGKGTFFERMTREIERIKCQHPVAKYIGMSDGAKDHWTFLEKHTDIQILDFYHATEYMGEASKAMFPKVGDAEEQEQWLTDRCHQLKHEEGAADRIEHMMRGALGKARTKNQRAEIQKAVTYFANNKHRMNYCENVKNKLSIGSGVTEAGCKVIIKQRLCQAGMRWKEKGCASVLALRALNRTEGRWDQFWSKISQYGVPAG